MAIDHCCLAGPVCALGDLADFLPLSGYIHHNQVAVPCCLWIDANVRGPPVLIADSVHDLRIRPAPLEAIR